MVMVAGDYSSQLRMNLFQRLILFTGYGVAVLAAGDLHNGSQGTVASAIVASITREFYTLVQFCF